MANNPVVWFEIPAADLNRAKAFYEHLLGAELTLKEMGPLKMAWFPMDENATTGATGTLIQAESYTPQNNGTLVYLSVDDIETALKKVTEKGGKILNEKFSIGEFGFVGHFEDCEGNRVALHSDT